MMIFNEINSKCIFIEKNNTTDMDAETSMKNDSFQIEEFSKQEIVIEEHEMDNKDAVRKAIKKYQGKINEM